MTDMVNNKIYHIEKKKFVKDYSLSLRVLFLEGKQHRIGCKKIRVKNVLNYTHLLRTIEDIYSDQCQSVRECNE